MSTKYCQIKVWLCLCLFVCVCVCVGRENCGLTDVHSARFSVSSASVRGRASTTERVEVDIAADKSLGGGTGRIGTMT